MNELGRRYSVFASTPRGRQRILVGLIVLACVLDVVASLMARSSVRSHTVGTLYSFAGGILLVAVIFLFTTRRSR